MSLFSSLFVIIDDENSIDESFFAQVISILKGKYCSDFEETRYAEEYEDLNTASIRLLCILYMYKRNDMKIYIQTLLSVYASLCIQ